MLKITPYNFNTLKTKQNPSFGSKSTDILKGWKKYSSGILKPNDCDLLDLRKYKEDHPQITAENYNEILNVAHPDFFALKAKVRDITASCFFRHGSFYGTWSEAFQDVVNVFGKLFKPNQKKPVDMLIVGIGKSQEPFSYLATIKELVNEKQLKDVLNLHTIDIQGRPPKEAMFEYSFFEGHEKPPFASSSFVLDDIMFNSKVVSRAYRVNDEILSFLSDSYGSNNSKWATRVQDVIADYEPNKFDVVSANNVLGYINDDSEFYHSITHLLKAIKKKGFLISDEGLKDYLVELNLNNNFIEIARGIWQKQS